MGKKGLVFNIQHYSLHDGPGIRTIIFFKGCPLRCRWCCNPESQNHYPEISYDEKRCLGNEICSECQKVCENNAIMFSSEGKAIIQRDKCSNCMKCIAECPAKAYKKEGIEYTADELLDIVEQDSIFYRGGNGGLTVSGGEPLIHGQFLIDLLKAAKKLRLSTAMETCGYADYSILKQTAEYLDTILFDIKSLDNFKHIIYTGKSNQVILNNFESLCNDFPHLHKHVRTPVIPGFNNSIEDLQKIEDYLKDKPAVTYEKLSYHRFGVGKYKTLGRKYPMDD
ncbi:glycyl-radical enzyme activating protein [Pectinatus frisingensis]|uniref:glycyl-radical enzyme activating protein n=1 Tax=Pectinatus frisingensis TaxID=865 RepID=UPI0018C553F9|nr:glycyl-radical enzyme activating protein [Pectinatus frisingensis]